MKTPKVCTEPGCSNNSIDPRHGRCEIHAPKRWENSTRATLMDKHQWTVRRKRILRRAKGICRFCGSHATVVDHRLPLAWGGDPYRDANLQALCSGCHDIKTKEEAILGRALSGGMADQSDINAHVARWT